MNNTAVWLATTGILQFKRITGTNTAVFTDVGSLTYTGFAPIVTTSPLPIVVGSPLTGELSYTGFSPSVLVTPIFELSFTSSQETWTRDSPWVIRYYVYDNTLNLRNTIIHYLNMGDSPPLGSSSDTIIFSDYEPFYVDVEVERLTETFGPPPQNNLTNEAGTVIWQLNGLNYETYNFTAGDFIYQLRGYSGFASGTDFGVLIYEG